MSEAGKGVRPVPHSQQYRDNWDGIDWGPKIHQGEDYIDLSFKLKGRPVPTAEELKLTERDFNKFVDALETDEPNQALKDAAKRFETIDITTFWAVEHPVNPHTKMKTCDLCGGWEGYPVWEHCKGVCKACCDKMDSCWECAMERQHDDGTDWAKCRIGPDVPAAEQARTCIRRKPRAGFPECGCADYKRVRDA